MRVLEIFSGTKSFGKVAEKMGWEVISLDLQDANINIDIMEWDYKSFGKPGDFDLITMSPPCRTFSHLRKCWVGRKLKEHGDNIITNEILQKDIEEKGLPILYRALDVVFYFQPRYWIIETRKCSLMSEYLSGVPDDTLVYCMDSNFCYRKITNLLSYIEGFKPKLCNKECGNINKNKHKIDLGGRKLYRHICSEDGGNISTGYLGTNLKERYRIPQKLIEELFYCLLIND